MSTTELPLTYEEILTALYRELDDPVLVPNLGTNTAAAMRFTPRADTLYLWGGMGLTHSLGLGLALARPERTVVALDGDGSLLMGLSGMSTIAVEQPANLLHVVLDNGVWGNTGGQPTHSTMGVHLDAVAAACGYPHVERVAAADTFRAALRRYREHPACSMVLVELPYYDPGPAPDAPDPVGIKRAFMHSLGSPSH